MNPNKKAATLEEQAMFRVKVLDPDIAAVLQKLAFKAGFKWGNVQCDAPKVMHTDKETLYFDTLHKAIWYHPGYTANYVEVSIEDAIKRLKDWKPDITIAGHVVKFTPQGISVGCTQVDLNTIEEICRRLKKATQAKDK